MGTVSRSVWSSLSSVVSSVIGSFWDSLSISEELAVCIEEVLSGFRSSPEIRSQEVIGLLESIEYGFGKVSLGLGGS